MLKTVSNRRNTASFLLAIAASAFLLQADSAWARGDEVETRSLVITIYDLDLHSPEGNRELDRRIGRAARRVCAETGEHIMPALARCISEARRSARRISLWGYRSYWGESGEARAQGK